MTSFGDAQSEDFNKIKTKTFDEISLSKEDKIQRNFIKKHPSIIDTVCDVIRKDKKIGLQTLQHRATYLGTKIMQANEKIITLSSEYDKIAGAVIDEESEKVYLRLRKQDSYIFSTMLSSCSGLQLSISELDTAILSDIAKKMGYYPRGIFVMSFLIGVRDASCLNTYLVSKIDKEISSFWVDVDRRIFKLRNNAF